MGKPAATHVLLLVAAAAHASPVALNLTKWQHKRVLVISAHPDDAEGFVGGTLARLQELDLNVSVAYLVVTSGNAGGDCYDMATGEYRPSSYACEPEEMAFIRRREM